MSSKIDTGHYRTEAMRTKACAPLLPEPGDEVVREMSDRIILMADHIDTIDKKLAANLEQKERAIARIKGEEVSGEPTSDVERMAAELRKNADEMANGIDEFSDSSGFLYELFCNPRSRYHNGLGRKRPRLIDGWEMPEAPGDQWRPLVIDSGDGWCTYWGTRGGDEYPCDVSSPYFIPWPFQEGDVVTADDLGGLGFEVV